MHCGRDVLLELVPPRAEGALVILVVLRFVVWCAYEHHVRRNDSKGSIKWFRCLKWRWIDVIVRIATVRGHDLTWHGFKCASKFHKFSAMHRTRSGSNHSGRRGSIWLLE